MQFTYVIQVVVDIIAYKAYHESTLFRQLVYNFIHSAIVINMKQICIRLKHTVFVTHELHVFTISIKCSLSVTKVHELSKLYKSIRPELDNRSCLGFNSDRVLNMNSLLR